MSYPVFSRISLCAALFFAFPAFADVEISAPPVTVSEPSLFPLPIGMTADDADLARLRSATGDTASLFSNTPGVTLQGAGGVSSLPALHGLADDRIRIKVDGMDLISACVNHMNPPLSYIDPANVASAQVYAGITPVSLGGDSIAGTIQVNSAAPEFAVDEEMLTKGQISTFYRSNNHARGVNFSAMLADDQVSVRYTGSAIKAGDAEAARNFKPAGRAAALRGWLAGNEIGSTAYEAQNHALNIAFKHDNHLLDLKLGLQYIPYQGFPNQRMDMTSNKSEQINLRYVGQFDWGNLEAAIFNEHTRHSMQFGDDKLYWYDGTAAFNVAGMPMDTEGRNTGVTLKTDILLSERDTLRVGAEYRRYRLDDWWSAVANSVMMAPDTFWNIRNGKRDRTAVYTEWEARWNNQWTTLAGLRHETVKMNTDAVQGYSGAMYGDPGNPASIPGAFNARDRSKTDHNLDFTALARFTPDAEKTFEAGYAIKTRSPNLYERYVWSSNNSMVMNMNNWVGDGNGYVGNLDLDPETAHTVSLAGKWQNAQKWNLRVAPYYSYVRDYIDAVPCAQIYATCPARADGFVNLSLANQNARLYGVDISGELALGSIADIGTFSANGLINYTHGKNTTTDDDLYNIMPLNATLALEHRLNNWSNRLETKMVSAKTRTQAVRKELQTGGYALLNFYSSYTWKQVRFDLGIENLLDKYYANPLGGAYLGQGATMMTAIQHGTTVPGWGRSINTSVTVMF